MNLWILLLLPGCLLLIHEYFLLILECLLFITGCCWFLDAWHLNWMVADNCWMLRGISWMLPVHSCLSAPEKGHPTTLQPTALK